MKLFLIVGYPRSGTSLIANQVNKFAEVVVTPESHALYDPRLSGALQRIHRETLAKTVSEIDGLPAGQLGLKTESILEQFLVNPNTPRTPWRFLESSLCLIGHKNKVSVCGEKTPGHYLHILKLLKQESELKILFVLRRACDTVASNLQVGWGHNSILRHSYAIANCFDIAFRAKKKYKEQLHFTYYENFVKNSEVELVQLGKFLDLQNCRNIKDVDNGTNTIHSWEYDWKKNARDIPSSDSIGNSKFILSKNQLFLIESITNSKAKKVGLQSNSNTRNAPSIFLGNSLLVRCVSFVKRIYRQIKPRTRIPFQ